MGEKAFKRAELLKECLGTLQYKGVETKDRENGAQHVITWFVAIKI